MKLAFIWLCNLIDTLATLHFFNTGMFVELNPFMAFLLKNPIVFAIVKIGAMTVILVRLWSVKEDRRAKIAMNVGCWIYGVIAAYYIAIFLLQICNY